MTPSIDQALHLFANVLPNWTLIPILTLLPNCEGFHRTLQRVRLANRGRLLLRTPGPVPFGTCICSYVDTILSWTCHVCGPFEFRTSLGTSILLLLRCIHHFKSDLINNMDHMRISGNEPSSVILSQTKWFQKLKKVTRKSLNKVKPKGMV